MSKTFLNFKHFQQIYSFFRASAFVNQRQALSRYKSLLSKTFLNFKHFQETYSIFHASALVNWKQALPIYKLLLRDFWKWCGKSTCSFGTWQACAWQINGSHFSATAQSCKYATGNSILWTRQNRTTRLHSWPASNDVLQKIMKIKQTVYESLI